jgi:hypothetical protein
MAILQAAIAGWEPGTSGRPKEKSPRFPGGSADDREASLRQAALEAKSPGRGAPPLCMAGLAGSLKMCGAAFLSSLRRTSSSSAATWN